MGGRASEAVPGQTGAPPNASAGNEPVGAHAPRKRTVRHRRRRAAIVYTGLACALAALLVASLCIGSVEIPPADVPALLAAGPGSSTESQVLWQIRLPRALMAIVLGGALALSGFLLQTFFANPIADPFVLGISSGARCAVAIVMIVVLGANQIMSPWMSVGAALAGSLATMGFVLLIARRVRTQSMLIIAGIMVGYICSAATNFLVAFADDQSIVSLQNWTQGSFSGAAWPELALAAAATLVLSAAVFALSKPLGAYQLGEGYAQSVGVDVVRLRMLIVLASSVLSACVTAFAGPVSFVGIAAPHLAKLACGTAKPIVVTPACFLAGAVFCCGCDLIARTLFSPVELSVSAVTAVFGAPIVIALWVRKGGYR